MGVQFGFLFGGTLLIEVIYSYPGLGNLMVDAVRNADLPIIQAVGLTYCVVVLLINTVVDAALCHPQSEAEDRVMTPCRRWLRSGRVLAGLTIVAAIALIALFAPLHRAARSERAEPDLDILLPPAWATGGDAAFPLGTDSLGRCVLSRLIYGARIAHDGRDRRLARRDDHRRRARAHRRLFRRLDRLADRPHGRRVDVVSAGDPRR